MGLLRTGRRPPSEAAFNMDGRTHRMRYGKLEIEWRKGGTVSYYGTSVFLICSEESSPSVRESIWVSRARPTAMLEFAVADEE